MKIYFLKPIKLVYNSILLLLPLFLQQCSPDGGQVVKDRPTNNNGTKEILSNIFDNRQYETQAQLVVVGLSQNDCVMCYEVINQNLKHLKNQVLIPQSNILYLMPSMRKVAKKAFIGNTIPIINPELVVTNSHLFNKLENDSLESASFIMLLNGNLQPVAYKKLKSIPSQKELFDFITN